MPSEGESQESQITRNSSGLCSNMLDWKGKVAGLCSILTVYLVLMVQTISGYARNVVIRAQAAKR